jgi:hypothetical protein
MVIEVTVIKATWITEKLIAAGLIAVVIADCTLRARFPGVLLRVDGG